jgi:hypothetical protein
MSVNYGVRGWEWGRKVFVKRQTYDFNEAREDELGLLPSVRPHGVSAPDPGFVKLRQVGVEPWGDAHHVGFPSGIGNALPGIVVVGVLVNRAIGPHVP